MDKISTQIVISLNKINSFFMYFYLKLLQINPPQYTSSTKKKNCEYYF